MRRTHLFALAGTCLFAMLGLVTVRTIHMGPQPDGSFVVSSGQRIEGDGVAFEGRPIDLALHPTGRFAAVLCQSKAKDFNGKVFLVDPSGIIAGSEAQMKDDESFHGLVWTPDGRELVASLASGKLQFFKLDGMKLSLDGVPFELSDHNPVPGGMCVTKDGRYLYVACANLNAVVEIDLRSKQKIRQLPVEQLPFTVKLSADEQSLIVSNWGGRFPAHGDRTALSEDNAIVVDNKGAALTGTVSVVDRATGRARSFDVGIHPTEIEVDGDKAYVANAMSDSVSEIDVNAAKVLRTIPLRWGRLRVVGSMPDALAVRGEKLLVADGGDNAVCQIDLPTGKVEGYRHAGYYPVQIAVAGDLAYVLNTKGNGSVVNTVQGKPGNVHQFQGTVTLMDLRRDLATETQAVARNDGWQTDPEAYKPNLAVYKGAIQHVLYIIKENRTYDEIFGDMPEGNGDPKLCDIGEEIMPNHHAIVRAFTLFDNAYVSGTNSADGHQWCDESLADDYLEHFYPGFSRTYPDDGADAMAIPTTGCIWDAAAKKHKSIRDYGEFTNYDAAEYRPYRPKDWFEAWDDRQKGTHKFTYIAHTNVEGLKPYIDPNYHYWPLIMSDQARADEFIREYSAFSKRDSVPNLMIMSLPSDHTEGMSPDYPLPKSMMADNDLALGRIVEAVSESPQWKNTCIFVIEDDAQAGPDHVDGHRTSYMVISPYNKRHTVDSNFYTTTNMVRSIEMMLGLDPMNRFDAVATPIDTCFQNTPDLTPYKAVPNRVPLGLKLEPKALDATGRAWLARSESLDWSHLDGPDSFWLNRVTWYSLTGGLPYPSRAGEAANDDDQEAKR